MVRLSPYPRRGQRIAPSALKSLLDIRIPDGVLKSKAPPRLKLADLDESAWRRFEPDECNALAKSVDQRGVIRRRFELVFERMAHGETMVAKRLGG